MRRQFALPSDDLAWLEGRGHPFELIANGSQLTVVIDNFKVPDGFNHEFVMAFVRIEPGYPDSQIDMVYFCPGLALTSGRAIGAVSEEQFDGRSWQRWSRHRTGANPWRPGVDCLETHFSQVESWLQREIDKG